MSLVEIELTESEKELLAKQDKRIISNFEATRLEKDARKNWDKFYMRNTTNFFKDRHWTEREFKELNPSSWLNQKYTICESGCGVGNFIFPLLEEHSNIIAFACDFSQRAVDFVAQRAEEQNLSDRLTVFQCDLTDIPLDEKIETKCDLVTMVFVLSAIHPSKFVKALKNLTSLLGIGGKLLFRDYAVNDHAMIRFKPGSKISDRMYARHDGTRSYFFNIEEVKELASESGLEVENISYCERMTVNKKENVEAKRLFLQARFRDLI